MKILFVDDNKDLGEVFLSLAQLKKVDLIYLESPVEALSFYKKTKWIWLSLMLICLK